VDRGHWLGGHSTALAPLVVLVLRNAGCDPPARSPMVRTPMIPSRCRSSFRPPRALSRSHAIAVTARAHIAVCTSAALLALAVFPAALGHAQRSADLPDAAQSSRPAKRTRAPARTAKSPPLSASARAEIDQAEQLLNSDQKPDIETGIQSLGLLGVPQAVDPLVNRIREGLPPELLELAVTTLMALGQPNAGPVLYELTTHRRSEIRRQAIEAIAATRPVGAEPVLLGALSDEETQVRSAAAIALGEVGSPGAVERLFVALDHGNSEASMAIGKLVAPTSVRKLSEYIGEVPFHHMGPALSIVLARRDVPEPQKLELIARLEEVGTPEVRGYLGNLLETSRDSLSPAVQRAIARAMAQIGD
jgi:HEAT repeat protein